MRGFHLERGVEFSTNSEYKNLYTWFLTEVGEDGAPVGSPQIPWDWTLYFHSQEIDISHTVSTDIFGEDDKKDPKEARFISAKLKTGRQAEWGGSFVVYKMFGTNRMIRDISLTIRPLKSMREKENCRAWGMPSYDYENDFVNTTSVDMFGFEVEVKPDQFERFLNDIMSNGFMNLTLSVSFVKGFYSSWSPSITTSDIKILTGDAEHKVLRSEEHTRPLPVLGDVKEFSVGTVVRVAPVVHQEDGGDRDDTDPSAGSPDAGRDLDFAFAPLLHSLARIERLLGRVWLAMAVLLVVVTLLFLRSCARG